MFPKRSLRGAAVLSLSFLFACGPQEPGDGAASTPAPESSAELGMVSSAVGASTSVHVKLGLADSSTTSTSNPNHYLSVKRQYVISYNASHKTPNWSAWQLNSSWVGSASRQDTFRPDDTLPSSIAQAALSDYSGSGYDRGHMCPSADRTLNTTDNSADRKSTRLNCSHSGESRMPSSA